jgi:Protein of unknown function (DUF2946)
VQKLRHRLSAFTWIALFAMFGLALAPTISHAVNASNGANPWAEICSTANGNGSGAPTLPGTLSHADHCPLCGHGAGPLGLPPSAVLVLPMPQRALRATPLAAVAVAQGFSWAVAQPRAPPSFS